MKYETKLVMTTSKGTHVKCPATIEVNAGRIWFLNSPFALKDEIKSMRGAKYHGFDENPRRIWSVEDCPRNHFHLEYLEGKDVYAWFDREVERHTYRHSLMEHQRDLADRGLTYRYQIWAAEAGTGKTLSAQSMMEVSGLMNWWWVGPKNTLANIVLEFEKWDFDVTNINVEFMSYDGLVSKLGKWSKDMPVPEGIIFDEFSKAKNDASKRGRACQFAADLVRSTYGMEGIVVGMTGTPATKSPVDYWSQAEIIWPGFLREGSPRALERRLAFMVEEEFPTGVFQKRIGWKDDENKCQTCGYQHSGIEDHDFVPSVNEVAYLRDRLEGLLVIKFKKDCLDLPQKRERVIYCDVAASTLRAAQTLVQAAPNTMTGLTWLRELSDGFLYQDKIDGKTNCNHCEDGKVDEWFTNDLTFTDLSMLDDETIDKLEKRTVNCPACGGTKLVDKVVRETREIPCPKDDVVRDLLDECEETGRIVMFAAFTGSLDRLVRVCQSKKWAVVRCDGRGMTTFDATGKALPTVEPLRFWKDWQNEKVAFVAHPESGGYGLTLTESRMAVHFSNVFRSEIRVQADERIHRPGMDENLGCEIVDIIHLPSDERVMSVVKEDRRVELLTLGEIAEVLV